MALYWQSQSDLMLGDSDQIQAVDTKVLYALYFIEFLVMCSTYYGRMVQYKSMNRGTERINQAEKESEHLMSTKTDPGVSSKIGLEKHRTARDGSD